MTRTTKRTRRGFTLVELLVVLTIIVVLVSLTAVGVFRLMGVQQSANTKSELTKLEGQLQQSYRAAADKFAQEPIPTPGSATGNVYYNTVLPMAGNDRLRAQVIWTKLRLKQTFPTSFSEAINPAPMPALPYYKAKLTGYTAAPPQPYESSVCLLWALQRGEDNGGVRVEDLGVSSFITSTYKGQTVTLPNGQTAQWLVDGWGSPLAFCRWPVYSPVLNPPNGADPAHPGHPNLPNGAHWGDNNDPGDPSGLLAAASWQGTYAAQFMAVCHPINLNQQGQEAYTFRVYPLIVSPGPDKKLGLDPTNFFQTTSAADAADNLYPTLTTER